MSIKFRKEPTSVIKARLGIEPNGPIQQYFTQRCRVHMDKYIPRDTGNLAKLYVEGKNYIEYLSPYAHYQYEGTLYVDPNTGSSWAGKDVTKVPTNKKLVHHAPGTGPHWDKRMWSAEKKKVIGEVQKRLNLGGK